MKNYGNLIHAIVYEKGTQIPKGYWEDLDFEKDVEWEYKTRGIKLTRLEDNDVYENEVYEGKKRVYYDMGNSACSPTIEEFVQGHWQEILEKEYSQLKEKSPVSIKLLQNINWWDTC